MANRAHGELLWGIWYPVEDSDRVEQVFEKAWHVEGSHGVGVRYAGHCDDPDVFFVYVDASRKTAQWSGMVPVTSLEVDPAWGQQLRQFCAYLDLPWQEPGWWLTSRYG